MNWLIIPISALLYRYDGWGKEDGFLPFWFFKNWKWGGINYTRYAIGPIITLITDNWWYLLTYTIAVSIPYGENSILEKYWGPYKWFIVGALFGGASLSLGMSLWLGVISFITKAFDIDHSIWEFFIMGGLGTIVFYFK